MGDNDVSFCRFCPGEVQVKVDQMETHLLGKHHKALFKCTMCDDGESELSFDTFAGVKAHVESSHNVTTEEGVKAGICIPPIDFLRAYTCSLCQREFVGTTEQRMIEDHFTKTHKISKVKPAFLKKRCRICNASAKSDTLLLQHITTAHPIDEFGNDEDEDDEDEEEEAEEEEQQPVAVPEPPKAVPAPPQSVLKKIKQTPPKLVPTPVLSGMTSKKDKDPDLAREIVTPFNNRRQSTEIIQKLPQGKLRPIAISDDEGTGGGQIIISPPKLAKMMKKHAQPAPQVVEGLQGGFSITIPNTQPLLKQQAVERSTEDSSSSSSSEEDSGAGRKKKLKKRKKKEAKKAKKQAKKAKKKKEESEPEEESDDSEESEVEIHVKEPRSQPPEPPRQHGTSRAATILSEEGEIPTGPLAGRLGGKLAVAEGLTNSSGGGPRKVVMVPKHPRSPLRLQASSFPKRESPSPPPQPAKKKPSSPPRQFRGGSYDDDRRGEQADKRDNRNYSPVRDRKFREERRSRDRQRDFRSPSQDSRGRHTPYERSRSRDRGRDSEDEDNVSEPDECMDCNVRLRPGDGFYHFTSKSHYNQIYGKMRCFLCNAYADNPKQHLEMNHEDGVFRCRLNTCHKPKFLELIKIFHHMDERHGNEIPRNKSYHELVREHIISIPRFLKSYRCKIDECNRNFVGQSVKAVFLHQIIDHKLRRPDPRPIFYMCRICGHRKPFRTERELSEHVPSHYPGAVFGGSDPEAPAPGVSYYPESYNKGGPRGGGGGFRGRERGGRGPRGRSSRSRSRSSSRSSRSSSRGRHRRRSSRHYSDRSRSQSSRSPASRHRRRYVDCQFCPQVTEDSVRDIEEHCDKNHDNAFFECRDCNDYRSAQRSKIVEHLRDRHKYQPDTHSDDALVRSKVKIPRDVRRIVCVICKPSGTYPSHKDTKAVEWLCQSKSDIDDKMRDHCAAEHPEFKLGECVKLACRCCGESFELNRDSEWKEHLLEHNYGSSSSSKAEKDEAESTRKTLEETEKILGRKPKSPKASASRR